jgi:hypothetical protein
MTGDTILDQLQADAAALLSATPELADAAVITADEGDIEQRILRALGPLNTSGTAKSGLALVVLPPEITDAQPNLPGPAFAIALTVQVIEAPLVNRDTDGNGTGIRSAVAALRTLSALHLWHSGSLLLYADSAAIRPLETKPGFVSHSVTLLAKSAGLATAARAARPTASVDGLGNIVLASTTGGAVIYYTDDGTYPHAGNADAILYEDPIADLEDGDQVRTAAYATSFNPSECLNFTVNITD